MKKNVFWAVMFTGLLFVVNTAQSTLTINDNYYGGLDFRTAASNPGIDPGVDLIGDAEHYDVDRMVVDINASTVSVDIYSRWFDSMGGSQDPNNLIKIGDFFISIDDWTPDGSSADNYAYDVIGNGGEDWEFAVVFDDTINDVLDSDSKLVKKTGDFSLYSIPGDQSGIIPASTATGSYRPGQEILYQPGTDQDDVLSGTWTIFGLGTGSDEDDYLSFSFGNTLLGLTEDEFAFRWTMTCANDIIEGGSAPVPEPATLLLFGTGLAGLAGRRWKRRKK